MSKIIYIVSKHSASWHDSYSIMLKAFEDKETAELFKNDTQLNENIFATRQYQFDIERSFLFREFRNNLKLKIEKDLLDTVENIEITKTEFNLYFSKFEKEMIEKYNILINKDNYFNYEENDPDVDVNIVINELELV